MTAKDTIYALSSGAPPAGVAVIRVSGPGVRFGLETLIDSVPKPRMAALRRIRSGDGSTIDRGLVLFFPAPTSFTGEDVAELHLHGGRAVVAAVLERLGGLPEFRNAEAGEFTRRAFANARMDLTQVEGLADLVAAETEAQRRQAVRVSDGAVGTVFDRWRSALVRARALLEAELDFPDEEDVPGAASEEAWRLVGELRQEMVNHLGDKRGERIRDGADVVVLGAPNAGKSSLINAIAKRDVAIVTPESGTTRDLIEVRVDLAGFAATLVDTAGLRQAEGAVEREGIRRATARAEAADLVLWLEDATAPRLAPPALAAPVVVGVGTKADLLDSDSERSLSEGRFDHLISSVTGVGIDGLLKDIAGRLATELSGTESPLVTRDRHRQALRQCVELIGHALVADAPLELRAEDLRRAGDVLGRVTGRIGVEDLLDVIFREFCIGK
jgi:tRNA modification GTPase